MSSMENMKNVAMDLAANASDVLSHPPNDYYPLGTAIPGYVANEASMAAILTVFFGTCAILFGGTHFVSKRLQPDLSRTELLTLLWFILSGCIHIFFEGYYVMNVLDIGTHQTWIGQMWKEYAFSDSRYLTQNAFVLCMESITAIAWGPGCLLVAAMVLGRHPLRFPLQGLVSLGQVYGDVLYYGTAYFEHIVYGLSYSRPEPFYFYFYFIFMNAIWMVIPGGKFFLRTSNPKLPSLRRIRKDFPTLTYFLALIYQSVARSASALATVQRLEASKKMK
jgi:cholestenol delta-isomerase